MLATRLRSCKEWSKGSQSSVGLRPRRLKSAKHNLEGYYLELLLTSETYSPVCLFGVGTTLLRSVVEILDLSFLYFCHESESGKIQCIKLQQENARSFYLEFSFRVEVRCHWDHPSSFSSLRKIVVIHWNFLELKMKLNWLKISLHLWSPRSWLESKSC